MAWLAYHTSQPNTILLKHDHLEEDTAIDIGTETPVRFVSPRHLYSATSPCVTASGSSNVMSKKVKARKIASCYDGIHHDHPDLKKTPSSSSGQQKHHIIHVYTRRAKRELSSQEKPPLFDTLISRSMPVKTEPIELETRDESERETSRKKKRRIGCKELENLAMDVSVPSNLNGPRLREARYNQTSSGNLQSRKRNSTPSVCSKRWVSLCFDDVDPKIFIGLQCKVHWPLDDDWYSGRVTRYDSETNQHCVEYEDGDEEQLIFSNEKIKFYVSREEMQRLNLTFGVTSMESEGLEFSEMVVLAANLDVQELEPGDIIWAKLTGHAMWPAVVSDGSRIDNFKGLNGVSGGKSVAVQFFGTHDFARIKPKQTISFFEGLLSSLHLKCKKPCFIQGLDEAKMYLREQKLPKRMLDMQNGIKVDDSDVMKGKDGGSNESGAGVMYNPEVVHLILELPNPKSNSGYSMCKLPPQKYQDLPVGYRPVRVDWRDLDKCNVCHMDEEYENNLFLQCDKCRMMVHARCYGELEPVNGVLWLCNLCRSDTPESPPTCCLCPVIGGAMKPTTDGHWAHLACAIWIPETCLSDVKRMEPIDGLSRIHKDRWKLLCSICGVSYGACIQCSDFNCRVAYHPLCARAAGLCAELENEDGLNLVTVDEDEENQCIRLLSFCKKHRRPSNERSTLDDRSQSYRHCSNYIPPSNPSGCARSEPYNYFGRRGRKEPEALEAASSKRLFVENRPYFVGGYSRHESFGDNSSSSALLGSKFSLDLQKLKTIQLNAPKNIISMSEKYTYMKETFKKRLAFGKSRIHGFGIFTKHPHRAGDMVIEYTGELVRPSIADRREHFIYNSLVGAGTYMFRIDDERVIDATRYGSIAHLINHSCEPNCYSRVISVDGDEHIIIFAKRDIKRWEELTYDYRFFSIDEQLACYCGFPGCRSVVNDTEAEEQMAKLYAPCSELIDWTGE